MSPEVVLVLVLVVQVVQVVQAVLVVQVATPGLVELAVVVSQPARAVVGERVIEGVPVAVVVVGQAMHLHPHLQDRSHAC